MGPATAIELHGADIGYDGHPVIGGMDLRIAEGEVVGLLGANGSGKSTLVKGLLGLAPVQRGTIELFGMERHRFREWARVGYVPQRQTVLGGIPSTVHEVVASGLLHQVVPFARMSRSDRSAVAAAIDAVGLGDRSRATMTALSGGQQRRVLIARALASDPDLLVLDEPTAGVDAANQAALAETLATLARRSKTIVLITHELGPAAPIVTRTLVLRDGRIVHDGPADGAPDEHDDHWHHEHGAEPERGRGLGLADPGWPGAPAVTP